MQYRSIKKEEWDQVLEKLLISHIVYANVADEYGQDYELLRSSDISKISYNKPKPATSLKSFFLPVKENVTSETRPDKPKSMSTVLHTISGRIHSANRMLP